MTSVYGTLLLDPIIMASYYFSSFLVKEVFIVITSENDETTRLPAEVAFKMRGGNIGSWYIESVFTVAKALSLKYIDIVFTTVDNRVLIVRLKIVAMLTAGTYKFMWLSCVRSEAPIILNVEQTTTTSP